MPYENQKVRRGAPQTANRMHTERATVGTRRTRHQDQGDRAIGRGRRPTRKRGEKVRYVVMGEVVGASVFFGDFDEQETAIQEADKAYAKYHADPLFLSVFVRLLTGSNLGELIYRKSVPVFDARVSAAYPPRDSR